MNFEYKMPVEMIKSILKTRKDKKGSNQKYLCDYVNSSFGIKGNCIKVIGY